MKWVSLLPALLLPGCAASEPAARPLRDFRGIIHCHSLYSHDSKGTYEEILAAAKAANVDFVCITDHPPKGDAGLSLREGWKGLHDGVLFIQGHELAGTNLLAIGIREPVRGATPAEKIADIRRQGGVAIVSHPEEVADWEPYLTADGMEIFNVHAAFKKLRENPAKLAAALKAVKEDPERSFLHLQELDPAVLAKWDEINKTRRFVGIAGNDAHQNVNILGLQLDPYPRAFKFVSTHVRAPELSEPAILSALREGEAGVVFDILSPESPLNLPSRWPGEKECVTIHRLGPDAPGFPGPFEMEGVEGIGYGGHHRAEIWMVRPDGRRPWLVFNWHGRPRQP